MTLGRRRYASTAEEFQERMPVPLLMILARGGPDGLSTRELAHLSMASEATIKRRMKQLQKRGLVIHTDTGRWVQAIVLVPMLPFEAQAAVMASGGVKTIEEAVEVVQNPPVVLESQPEASDRAQHLAARFKLPPQLNGVELGLGPARPCTECESLTPLRYGIVPVCRRCAEAWAMEAKRDTQGI